MNNFFSTITNVILKISISYFYVEKNFFLWFVILYCCLLQDD